MLVDWLLKIAAQVIREFGVSIDTVPYTPTGESMIDRFRQLSGLPNISENEVWRYFMGARKRGLVGPMRRRSVNPS